MVIRRSTRRFLIAAALAVSSVFTAACGSDSTDPDPDPTPSITISLSPTNASVQQGGSTTTTATVTGANGFSGSATVTVEGVPSGVTGTVSNVQTTGSTTTATITIDVGAAVTPGSYNITARATGAGVTAATATFALTVTAAPAYTLTVNPTAVSVEQGASGSAGITLARTNFTGAVDLSLEGTPSGVTGTFDVDPVTGDASNLTIDVDNAVTTGDYPLTIRGTATGLSDRTAALTLTVVEPAPYTLSVDPGTLSIEQGSNAVATVTITRNTFLGAVTLSLGNAPGGVTGTFDPAAPTGNSSTLTVAVDDTVTAGTYNLTVDGTMVVPGPDGDEAVAAALIDQSVPLVLTITQPPSYTLGVEPAALSIEQGASGQTAVSIARINFTGVVNLSLGNAPSGVTGSFDPAAPTGSASTLSVNVDGAVAPGQYNLTVNGTATAGNVSTPLTLTVTEVQSFSLSMTPSSVSVVQGNNTSATINVARTGGFSGSVSFAVAGEPSGLTATPNPASTTGASSTLDISAGMSVTPGTYPLTITGTAAGMDPQNTTLNVTVTMSGGAGNVTIDFSNCAVADRPVWLAAQDGSGPWTQITGTADVYQFTINSNTGGLAYVTDDGADTDVNVFYYTQAEFTSGVFSFCNTTSGKTVTGTVSGLPIGGLGQLSLGSASSFLFANGPFTLNNVADGSLDLIGYAQGSAAGPNTADRFLARRNQNIADQGSLGTVDFAGGEADDVASGTLTVTGLTVNETLSHQMRYHTAANSCQAANLYSTVPTTSAFSMFGAPAGMQVAGDFHGAFLGGFDAGTSASRIVVEYFNSMASRTVALPTAMPTPNLTDLGGPYKRLQADLTLPAEYNVSAVFFYSEQGGNAAANIFATFGALGGTNVSLAFPDFTSVTGWDNSWAPGSGVTAEWGFTGTGSNNGGPCVEGGRTVSAGQIGVN